MPQPLYTASSCQPAFQLRWSLALFQQQPIPPSTTWLDPLNIAVERDGVRLLEQREQGNSQLFVASTRPGIAPPQIVKSVKGRLQNLIQEYAPQAFRRNFHLMSLGDANREAIEAYVASQLGHHRMADHRVDRMLADFQFEFPEVDLSLPQRSNHGSYLYNLHVVLVHAERWSDVRRDHLQTTADMIIRYARTHVHRLSRLSLLADHLHLTVGVPHDICPEHVALAYMNNIAFAHGMKSLFSSSYYVGTFGEYDMNAVRS